MKFTQLAYLGWWWVRAKFFGRKAPLQSVIFISDRCNLSCRHCSVYNHKDPITKTYAQIREELQYCLSLGSRFVDFEGGEPMLWRDGDYDINSLCDLAHELGGHAKPRCLYGNIGRSTSSIALKEGLTIGGEPCLSEIDEHFAECYELRRENVGHEGPHLMLTGCVRDLQGHPKGK